MAITMEKSELPAYSPLWQKALDRYNEELEDKGEANDLLMQVDMEDLIVQARSLDLQKKPGRAALRSLSRFEPTLTIMNDFAAVAAVCLGADKGFTALIWGTLRVVLKVATPAEDVLQEVLDMLEDIVMALPRFKRYERMLPMNKSFESCLLAVYTETICFCARTIKFFRQNPHNALRKTSWAAFDGDFKRTIERIKRLSRVVDTEADIACMQASEVKNTEVLELMKDMKDRNLAAEDDTKSKSLPFYHLPQGIDGQFYGREDILLQIETSLHPRNIIDGCHCFVLYGMGGVGKTQIALRYANQNRESFGCILWISADSSVKISQSFVTIANDLGLIKSATDSGDPTAAWLAVKSWLANSEKPWLLVFDNADDLSVLKHSWPTSMKGSVLLTTRDPSATFSLATHGYHVHPFDEDEGSLTFLSICGADPTLATNCEYAKRICRSLGGLPLALSQIGGFVAQQKLALADFLPLYERNEAKIHAKKTGLSSYEHTLDTVWAIALANLALEARSLQGLAAFLDPDSIDESVLTNPAKSTPEDLAFLADEMDFLEAKSSLLQASLIDRNPNVGSLSVHRLVQSAVIRRLSKEEISRYVRHIIKTLPQGFANHWKRDVGHQFATWSESEKRLPHIIYLVKQLEKHRISPPNGEEYAELLILGSWYCYEREMYLAAEELVCAALPNFEDKASAAYVSAIDLLGLISMDLARHEKALQCFEEALSIRKKILDENDPFIAFSFNNIAMAYTESGDFVKALDYHQRAIEIRLAAKSDRIGNSYSNLSSLLVCMGQPNAAEETLKKCPALKDLSDETFMNTGNPRFSGDMILLSRIREQQGKLDDAIRLSAKALSFRRGLLGNRLKVCDALTQLARQLQRRGNMPSAINFLEECISIAETLPEGKGYLARAHWILGSVFAENGNIEESENSKSMAIRVREEIQGPVDDGIESTDDFEKLVARMLW